ncbi:hypothetical protein Poli38472_009309 [Pythium oligandrum]|uniref:Uncharacterized protein n=1 Tax=Pythium oligandrum TaxID=41045 RepID=A0A8K1CMM3_PYTOL|nr:hypothetical protein Poli38472_009309 [Pythium oligandrum]|eukprot:TMW65142.1 hypothetical protein Poli38472_009309 [Pythium oligandrum]
MTDASAFETLLQPVWSAFPPDQLRIDHDVAKRGLRKELYGFCLLIPACDTERVETEWRRQCEAMELLLLASVVNPRELARLARKHLELVSQATHPVTWSHIGQDQDVPCRLVAEVGCQQTRRYQSEQLSPQWAAHGLSLLLASKTRVSERSDLSEIREKLLEMAPTPSVRHEWEAIKIPVCIRLCCKRDDTEVVVKYLRTRHRRQEGNASPFYTESVELFNRKYLSPKKLSHSMVGWLQELSAAGLALRWVDCDDFLDDRVAVAEAMRAITGASNSVIQGNLTYSMGVQVSELWMESTGNYISMCTGLMHSRGVEHVTMLIDTECPKWYWALYALFHASATHSIRSLTTCNMDFIEDDFREFIQAPQPLQVMYPSDQLPSAPKTGSFVVLNNKSRIYFDQHRRDEDEYVMASSIETPFRVIGANGDLTSVLVPCYGECWVCTSDIVSTQPDPFESDPDKQWNLTSHGITHLEFEFGCVWPTVENLGLLEFIGQPVTSIVLEFPRDNEGEVFELDKLWSFCPNLTELSIKRLRLASLDAFVQAYETGMCRLTSLHILGCDVLAQDGVAAFTKALGNPSTAISRTLNHLRVSLLYENRVPGGEVAQMFLSALQTNRRLSFFELQVYDDVLEMYTDEFEALNGSCLNYVSYPLPIRTTCAFLSVVKHAQTEAKDGPLARMDTFVLSRILDLAAEAQRRSVVLTERTHMFEELN